MSERSCKTCEHYGLGPGAGQGNLQTVCRFNPPMPMVMMGMDPNTRKPIQVVGAMWPSVSELDHCGQWQQRIRETLANITAGIIEARAQRVAPVPEASAGKLA